MTVALPIGDIVKKRVEDQMTWFDRILNARMGRVCIHTRSVVQMCSLLGGYEVHSRYITYAVFFVAVLSLTSEVCTM